jgi:hypothetical protein
MHRLRDNNPKEHLARALAELFYGARGSIVAQGLPDLRPLRANISETSLVPLINEQ